MGERSEILADAASGAAGAALGAVTGEPIAAVIGAGLAPVGSAVLRRLGEQTLQAVQWLAQRAARDGDLEALTQYLAGRPASSALLIDAGQAVARTEYEVKVEAIGRAMAAGVLYEEGVLFDAEAAVVRAVCRVERPHVAVLRAMGGWSRDSAELREMLPAYGVIIDGLMGELISLGLLAAVDKSEANSHPKVTRLSGDGSPLSRYERSVLGDEVLERFSIAGAD